MPNYHYKVRDKSGNLEEGIISAKSEEKAGDVLSGKGFYPVNIKIEKKVNFGNILQTYSNISLKDLMVFTKQFSVMIGAGLSIVEALKTLSEEQDNAYFSNIIGTISKDIEDGDSLSMSVSRYPGVFSDIYVSMIKAGEASGKLDIILDRLATQLEKQHELGVKVKSAMIYPAFILATMLIVGILMVSFVIPKLKPILETAGIKLPFLTKILIFTSESFINYWWAMIPSFLLLLYILKLYLKSSKGGDVWAYVKMNLPIAGPIIKKIYMARFTRTFSTLASSDINIIKCLEITGDSIGNIHYKKDAINISEKVKNGDSLTQAFQESDLFPNIVRRMVKVGESTGTIDSTVEKLAEYYEDEVDSVVNNLSKILEPLLIVVMGIGVALMVSSIIMPLYDATRGIKG